MDCLPMWIYLNDRFVSKEEAHISVFDHGLLYGDGLFETLRAYSGKIFRLSQHIARLARFASRLSISLLPPSAIEPLLYGTLARNLLPNAMLRLTITRGEGRIGLDPDFCKSPTFIITARALDNRSDRYKKGASGAIVTVRRNDPASFHPTLKTVSFLNNVLAKQEASQKGADEGIFLNSKGYLAEGSVSNLFWIKGGRLYTPAPEVGLLEGVTREVVWELAKGKGIQTDQGYYRSHALIGADEAFLTNSGIELMPLTKVDGKNIGTGRPGPLTRLLHQAYQTAVKDELGII